MPKDERKIKEITDNDLDTGRNLVTENYELEILTLKDKVDLRRLSRSFLKVDKLLKSIFTGKEDKFPKNTGFNREKTDLEENDTNKLFTALGALNLKNWIVTNYTTLMNNIKDNLNNSINTKLNHGGYGGTGQQLKNEVDTKVTKSGDTMTGGLNFSANNTGISSGNGDGADFTTSNLKLQSWFGIGLGPTVENQIVPKNEYSHYFNTRNGDMGLRGSIHFLNGMKIYSDSGALGFMKANQTSWSLYAKPDGGFQSFGASDINGSLTIRGGLKQEGTLSYGGPNGFPIAATYYAHGEGGCGIEVLCAGKSSGFGTHGNGNTYFWTGGEDYNSPTKTYTMRIDNSYICGEGHRGFYANRGTLKGGYNDSLSQDTASFRAVSEGTLTNRYSSGISFEDNASGGFNLKGEFGILRVNSDPNDWGRIRFTTIVNRDVGTMKYFEFDMRNGDLKTSGNLYSSGGQLAISLAQHDGVSYRIQNDGFKQAWGIINAGTTDESNRIVTLPFTFSNMNYNLQVSTWMHNVNVDSSFEAT
ncbi:MAG: tail fiber protein, partial [Paraclostridium sp.]